MRPPLKSGVEEKRHTIPDSRSGPRTRVTRSLHGSGFWEALTYIAQAAFSGRFSGERGRERFDGAYRGGARLGVGGRGAPGGASQQEFVGRGREVGPDTR